MTERLNKLGSGRKTKSQGLPWEEPGAAQGPRPGPTVSGEDVAEHGLELWRGGELLQDLSQALGGRTKEWREAGEQPILGEELSHGQREDLQQDTMSDSTGYHLGRE